MFLGAFLSWPLMVALLSAVFFLFITTILVPFRFADAIKTKVIQIETFNAILFVFIHDLSF